MAAVVIPHSGHGMPVSVRSGQGSHSPSPAEGRLVGAAAPAATRPATPSCSGTDDGRQAPGRPDGSPGVLIPRSSSLRLGQAAVRSCRLAQ